MLWICILQVGPDSIKPCSKPCCDVSKSEPVQITDEDILKETFIINGSGKHQKKRFFRSEWYQNRKWLVLCSTNLKAYCFYCRFSLDRNMTKLSTKGEGTFTVSGFNNWKRATEKFNSHENCEAHKEAVRNFFAAKGKPINAQINDQLNADQKRRRDGLLKQLSSLRFLLRQGLALRGHDENEGNLAQLLKLRAEDCPELRHWVDEKQYQSPEIVNELIQFMANDVLRKVLVNIREARWFGVMADECKDCSVIEQMAIIIRWVDDDYNIYEEPIGLTALPRTDAETLCNALKDALIRCMLPLTNVRGQGYDGASAMSGHRSGLATRIKQENEAALAVHCLAHCVNLNCQEIGKNHKLIRQALDLVYEIVGLIKYSPKRAEIFAKIQHEYSIATGLRPLCPHRWTCRTSSIAGVLENYEVLEDTMEEIKETCKDDYGTRAAGVAALLQKFETYFALKLAHLVFSASEQLSKTLQGKETNVQDACDAAKATAEFYKRQRNPAAFDSFYQEVLAESEDKTDPPVLPRYRRKPKKIDDGEPEHRFTNVEDMYRQQYIAIMEAMVGELNRRFEQKDLKVVLELESILINSANGEMPEISKQVKSLYAKDLDFDRLKHQLPMLPDLVKNTKLDGTAVKKVTKVQTICQIFNAAPYSKSLFSEVDALLKIFLTIPVTTATAERTFSVLRRVKTYLRATMTQKRLNHVLLLHIYKEHTDELDLVQVAQSFIMANERRQTYFGSFL